MSEYQRVKIDEVEIDEVGNVAVIRFCDRRISDLVEIESLGQELYQLSEERARKRLVVDFSAVEFFSSAAIGKLISLNGKVKTRGGVVKLCNVPPQILEVFNTCRLDRVFEIRHDRADALHSFED